MKSEKLELEASHPILCQIIADRIRSQPDRRISFAEFMDLALYHPQHGYYASLQPTIGARGDFFTSPHLGADFGELLAVQFVEMWERLDRPIPFTLVEMGAGQGLLAADVLRYLHRYHYDCYEALNYRIVEKSQALIAEQRQRLQKGLAIDDRVQWSTWDEIPSGSVTGCCFSNELVDALPVHLVTIQDGQLQEIYVTIDDSLHVDLFIETIGEPSTPDLTTYFELIGLNFPSEAYPNQYRTEVNLAALDWMTTVADRLQRGYVLTVDYGYPAHRYYNPARAEGTLQCYYQHAHHNDPYRAIGRQDITAHVDFTALEQQGKRQGLQPIGFTQQGLFLMSLGLGDRIAALSQFDSTQPMQNLFRRREALHALMNPMGLGNFGVLVQGKDVSNQLLRGLSQPSR